MFGKVLKYELRDGLRTFLPLWGAVLVASLVDGLLIRFLTNDNSNVSVSIVTTLLSFIVFALIVAVFVIVLVMIIQRFYNGLLGEGGYLAFSLPVSCETHVGARILASLILVIGCFIDTVFSSSVILWVQGNGFGSGIADFIKACLEAVKAYPNSMVVGIELVLFALLVLSFTILRLYSAMAVGHLFRKNRGIWSIVAYVVIGFFSKTVISLLTVFTGKMAVSGSLFGLSLSMNNVDEAIEVFSACGGIAIVYALIGNVILWFVTTIIIKKRLNLQ